MALPGTSFTTPLVAMRIRSSVPQDLPVSNPGEGLPETEHPAVAGSGTAFLAFLISFMVVGPAPIDILTAPPPYPRRRDRPL